MATSSRIMHHVTKLKSSQTGFLNMTMFIQYIYTVSHKRHGILFHSSIMTSRSCWMLDTWCFSTFRFHLSAMCSIGFRSGDTLDHSLTFTFSSKAVVILAVCSGWKCWKTVSEGRASSSASECHSTCWNPCFPQWTAATQYQQGVATPSESNKFTLDLSDHRTWFQ